MVLLRVHVSAIRRQSMLVELQRACELLQQKGVQGDEAALALRGPRCLCLSRRRRSYWPESSLAESRISVCMAPLGAELLCGESDARVPRRTLIQTVRRRYVRRQL